MTEDRAPYRATPGPLDALISEKDFQSQVIQLARTLGWLVYHTHDSRRSAPGFPDLVLVRDTRIVWAELKTERGRVGAAQRDWLRALNRAGAAWYVWRPRDWETLVEVLR